MRKLVFAAAIAGSALALSACSDAGDDTATVAAEETTAATDVDMMETDSSAVLDANTATAEEMAAVDGMTPEMAEAVVAGRPYETVTDLRAAMGDGVSDDEAAAVLTGVFVPVNLNTATREEIAMIPGMTDRMIGEFLEYRPYADMAEFDREIGKYVDETEVARFRNYVTL